MSTQTSMLEEPARFACLMADWPWPERGGGKIKRGADRHYDLVGKPTDAPAVLALKMAHIVRDSGLWLPAENAHAWFWYTDNYLEHALELMRALGFRYVRTFLWIKIADGHEKAEHDEALRMGIGQYGRGCHEGMLFGVRGRGQAPDVWTGNRAVRSVFHAPHVLDAKGKRVHSAKPPDSYDLIERVSLGPRVEFFARSERPGWLSWGNEATIAGIKDES